LQSLSVSLPILVCRRRQRADRRCRKSV